MKFVIEERVKHRLMGLVVILSIAAIFVPALMKKSNQHFEENVRLSVKLPEKPALPKIAVANEKALFQTIKVARVDKPTLVEMPQVTQLAKAEPISRKSAIPAVVTPSTVQDFAKTMNTPNKVQIIAKTVVKPAVAIKKELYAVQLASFSQQSNAESLVTRLRSHGFTASYNKILGKQGEYYKVIVGQLNQKNEAIDLQKKLAVSMQLQGFIIKTGAS